MQKIYKLQNLLIAFTRFWKATHSFQHELIRGKNSGIYPIFDKLSYDSQKWDKCSNFQREEKPWNKELLTLYSHPTKIVGLGTWTKTDSVTCMIKVRKKDYWARNPFVGLTEVTLENQMEWQVGLITHPWFLLLLGTAGRQGHGRKHPP